MNDKEILNHWVSPKRTVCEVLREVNDLAVQIPENNKMLALILEALMMAKKMDAKLTEYKKGWAEGIYGGNEDYNEDIQRRGMRG
jgi:hypothetical protein